MNKLSQNSALLLIILVTVTFFSCEKVNRLPTERVPKGDIRLGGVLKVATADKPTVPNPSTITNASSSEIGLHVHDGLLKLDAQTLEVQPGLAERWSVNDDGTSYIFEIRKGAKFHADDCFGNGSREITAHDFGYSFKQLCSAGEGSAFETTFKNRVVGATEFHDGLATEISGVKVLDDYTLSIQLIKSDPSFLFVLAQPSMAVVSKKVVDTYGESFTIGSGPFQFVHMDGELLLIRNEEYYARDVFGNRLPYLDSLIYKQIPTKEQQLKAFFDAEIDVVSRLYLDPVKQILEQHVADFSGKSPKDVMQRESESVGYESYSIFRSSINGFENNFMGYRDFSKVQIEQ